MKAETYTDWKNACMQRKLNKGSKLSKAWLIFVKANLSLPPHSLLIFFRLHFCTDPKLEM